MSGPPTISCVIPVHNGRRDLRRAVDSVLLQSPEVQVVLVDDCSTDGSADLVLEMAASDVRILAVMLPSNHGQGFARNVGVGAAEADYVTFLDQDDEHMAGWYVHAFDVLERYPGVAAVKGDVELVGIPDEVSLSRGDARWRAIVNSPIWNVVMRKIIYGVLGGCPTSSAYRTREGTEDIALITSVVRNFEMLTSSYVATRHYLQPNGATVAFLRRTTVVDDRIQYLQITDGEREAALSGAANEYELHSIANMACMRTLLAPQVEREGKLRPPASASFLQRLMGKSSEKR